MNLSLSSLATAFYVSSAAIGLPSVIGLLLAAAFLLHRQFATPVDGSLGVTNPDAILMILGGLTRFLEGIAHLVGFVGKYVMGGIAILGSVGLMLALALFLTARGLQAHQAWARGSAGGLMGLLLLFSLVLLTATRGLPFLVGASVTVGCSCALLAIWRGFPA